MTRTPSLALAGVGVATYVASARLASPEPGIGSEARVFRAVNGLPGWLYPLVWGPMQLGNLVVGAVVGVGVALVGGRPRAATAALGAVGLKLVVERAVRHRLGDALTQRQRPGTSQPGAVLRGDVPVEGHSFPSGHVILVAALAAILTPMLPRRWAMVPWAAVGLVAFGRVYVGAHNPLDVTAGIGLGTAVGAVLDATLGAD